MNSISGWTREYFLENQEQCLNQLSKLTMEERVSLKNNLHFHEPGSLVLIDCFFVTDMKEPEFYCEKFVIKKEDGHREVCGKYCDRVNIYDGEQCEDPEQSSLGERQVCIISQSSTNNKWIQELNSTTNKRKLDSETEKQQKYLVKIYNGSDVLLNQLVEVIGFIYRSPSPMETDEFGDEVEEPPTYNIHAISFKEKAHNNPLMLHDANNEELSVMHGDIHRFLTQFLFGDEIAAQYMLCHLISNIYARVNDEPLGKFSLNLICHAIPLEVLKEYTANLYNIMESLLPNSLYFPLTIENLNTCSLVPKKDYTKNRLLSGSLQLPKHTHIFIDETKLENGKLDQAGCMAVNDLSELIRTQQLSYDFQFYKIPYKTDLPVLIVSEGKSLLPVSAFSTALL
jgi:hypothetical protein